MPLGASKYDYLVARIMDEENAEAAVVAILGGSVGHGVGCKVRFNGDIRRVAHQHRNLALILRGLADVIEQEFKSG